MAVLEYARSYSGLERLSFGVWTIIPSLGSPERTEMVDYMLDIVLPQHAAALRELDLPFFYGSIWNFMRDELPGLSNFFLRCEKLSFLCLMLPVSPGHLAETAMDFVSSIHHLYRKRAD